MPASTKTKAGANRNPQIEKYLSDRGFTWEYRAALPLEEFDQEKSLRNQARVGQPLDEKTVRKYVDALGNGDEFPPIIAAETSATAPLQIVDGNHRYESYKRKNLKGIDTYIVLGADAAAVTILTFEANARHGLPTTETDKIHQGLWMMDTGLTAEDAARRVVLPVSKLRNAASLAAVDRRAEENHINSTKWDGLPDAAKKRLGQVTTDEGFAALTKLAIDANLSVPDISKLVSQLSELRSSRKQVEYVEAQRLVFAHQLQIGANTDTPGPGRRDRSGRQLFGMALGQLTALPAPETVTALMGDDEKPEWLRRTEDAITTLERFRDVLKA